MSWSLWVLGPSMQLDWVLGFELVITAIVAASGGVLLLMFLSDRAQRRGRSIFSQAGNSSGTILLFDGDVLIDSSPGARALLAANHARGGPWLKLMSYLAPHFPDLESQLLGLPHQGAMTLTSHASARPLLLHAEHLGGLTRLTLVDPEHEGQMPGVDPMAQRAQNEELDLLRQTIAKAPALIWRERADGQVIWANATYLLRAGETLPPGQELSWPLQRLFGKTASSQGARGQRQKLTLTDGRSCWYDLVGSDEGDGRLVFALPADSAVLAEGALRDFMQTLTKTFAHLHVGLAIFDQKRQLLLFNPALLDLTHLPADFLSMRPSLLSVLDAMRDRNMIPEPKDYRSWRRQIVEMEKAAASGLYEETWSLPGGQTYRVIGRPHPNGALALMIEDISSEMLRSRRYRADLELGQAVVDQLDEAIAVFSDAGQLVMTNSAYTALWAHDPSATLGEASLRALCGHWRSLSSPSSIWTEAEEYCSNTGDRLPWHGEARLLDGRLLQCRFAPLTRGASLAAFHLAPKAGAQPPVLAAGTSLRTA